MSPREIDEHKATHIGWGSNWNEWYGPFRSKKNGEWIAFETDLLKNMSDPINFFL